MPPEIPGVETGTAQQPKGLTAEFHLVRKLPSESESDGMTRREDGSMPKTSREALAYQFFPTEKDLAASNRRAALGALIEESAVSNEVITNVFAHTTPAFRHALVNIVNEYLSAWRSTASDKNKRLGMVRETFKQFVHNKLS